jgi:TatD-related deoxyribonuclease
MKTPPFPITDDHIHLDPVSGRGIEAARDFQRVGGTHLFLVNKPAGSHGIPPHSPDDYIPIFAETLRIACGCREIGLVVFPILGVHPAELTQLSERMSLDDAVMIMKGGLDIAADYIREGAAYALKSGRPHYEVPDPILNASNEVLRHAFSLGSRCGCAVQIHAESGPCADVLEIARQAGMPPERVVKHYGSGDTPLVPSLIARNPDIPALCRAGRRFMMESDYMDELSRPGAVIGPKSVPRFTLRLLGEGMIEEEDVHRIHTETPAQVYGVEIVL